MIPSPKALFQQLKKLLSEMKEIWKKDGFKGLYKKYGFKLFIFFIAYYLIRDSLIYIILPWLIAKHFLN